MKNKRILVIGCTATIVILLIVFFMLRGGQLSVVGEWKIDHYITEDGNISQDDIGEYFEENYQTANSAFSVVFESNGNAILYLPTYEGTETVSRECSYEIRGNEIYLSANEDTVKGFEIKENMLIVYNIASFDGNVVLREK